MTASINSNTTDDLEVASTFGFPSSGALICGQEFMTYTGTTPSTFTGLTRGAAGSNGASHAVNAFVGAAQVTAANVAQTVLLNTVDVFNAGIVLNPVTGAITLTAAGVYSFAVRVQAACAGNSADDLEVWFAVNGTPVPESTSRVTVPAIHGGVVGAAIASVILLAAFSPGDVVTLQWTTNDGTVAITSYGSSVTPHPTCSGIVVTVCKLQ